MPKRPTPTTIGDLIEICQYVTSPGTWLELNAVALRMRLENHADGTFWKNVPEAIYTQPLNQETQEAFERIRREWEEFRDAMVKVFGE